MIFNSHSGLKDKHALLSPSKSHWVNYDDTKLDHFVMTHLAAARGSELHELAARAIKLRVGLPKNNKTLNAYVNDAIGFRMTPEQTLVYSEFSFGTADAISFRKNLLRIHDLKTGVTRVSSRQLLVYAALFCLEYSMDPREIGIELRIYQNDEIKIIIPEPEEISFIMGRVVASDRRIRELREEVL